VIDLLRHRRVAQKTELGRPGQNLQDPRRHPDPQVEGRVRWVPRSGHCAGDDRIDDWSG
jgi:hypothetical protein